MGARFHCQRDSLHDAAERRMRLCLRKDIGTTGETLRNLCCARTCSLNFARMTAVAASAAARRFSPSANCNAHQYSTNDPQSQQRYRQRSAYLRLQSLNLGGGGVESSLCMLCSRLSVKPASNRLLHCCRGCSRRAMNFVLHGMFLHQQLKYLREQTGYKPVTIEHVDI